MNHDLTAALLHLARSISKIGGDQHLELEEVQDDAA